MLDAAFDRVACPSTYDLQPTSQTTACRIVIDSKRSFSDSELDCRDDSAGLTHLVAVTDQAELAMLRTEINLLPPTLDNNFWIGGVQLRDHCSTAGKPTSRTTLTTRKTTTRTSR